MSYYNPAKAKVELKRSEREAAVKDCNKIVDLRIMGYSGLLEFSVTGVDRLASHNVMFKYSVIHQSKVLRSSQCQQQAMSSTSIEEIPLKSKDTHIQITGTAHLTYASATPIQKLSQSIMEAYQQEGSMTPPLVFEVNPVATLAVQSLIENREVISVLNASYINEDGNQATCTFYVMTHYMRLDDKLISSLRSNLQRLENEYIALQLEEKSHKTLTSNGSDKRPLVKQLIETEKKKRARSRSAGSTNNKSPLVSVNNSRNASRTSSLDRHNMPRSQSCSTASIRSNMSTTSLNSNMNSRGSPTTVFDHSSSLFSNMSVYAQRNWMFLSLLPVRAMKSISAGYMWTMQYMLANKRRLFCIGTMLFMSQFSNSQFTNWLTLFNGNKWIKQ